MSTPATQDSLRAVVRASQFIVGALIAGPLPVLAIAAFIGPLVAHQDVAGAGAAPANKPPDTFAFIMNATVLTFGVLAVPLSFIVPGLASATGRKAAIKSGPSPRTAGARDKGAKLQTEGEAQAILIPQFPAQLIAGAAVLEGATFFAAAVYLLIAGLIAPAIAIVLIFVLIARFPTESRAQSWLDQQSERLRDEGFAAPPSP